MASLASNAPAVTRRAQRRLGIALVIPVTIMMAIFFLLPLGNALAYSVVDFDGVSPNPEFIGLANFKEMVFDPNVWHALGNNVIWIILGTAVPMVCGLLIALMLWGVQRGSVFYRVCFFLPFVLPGVAVGIVWGWIYDPVQGMLNETLGADGSWSVANPDPWKLVDQLKGFNWLDYYGGKFSTSQQRGVFMDHALELLPPDYWRWWIMANAPETSDSTFAWEQFRDQVNADLADVLGNFVNRICKFAESRFDGVVPEGGVPGALDEKLEADVLAKLREFTGFMEDREFRKATRFTRPGVDATLAVRELARGRSGPRAAALGVKKDLLDAYQARIPDLAYLRP